MKSGIISGWFPSMVWTLEKPAGPAPFDAGVSGRALIELSLLDFDLRSGLARLFILPHCKLAISLWLDMIPGVITIDETAASHSSLAFMFWGEGLFVVPWMLIYKVISCGGFRGKVGTTAGHN
jgi:hypothetical protein